METLKEILSRQDVRGVVRTSSGKIIEFHNRGVKDLFNLLAMNPQELNGAEIADRVIGRGAALLLVKGHVKGVYARLISEPALLVLNGAGITTSYDHCVPSIINREGTGMCPVEKLTMSITDSEIAFQVIEEFLKTKNK